MTKREKIILKRETVTKMRDLMIAPDKIMRFRQHGEVAVYDADTDLFLPPNDRQQEMIRKLNRGGEALVYFVLRQNVLVTPGVSFLMDSFLYLSLDLIEFLSDDSDLYRQCLAYTYTHNYNIPEFSEYGDIVVQQTSTGGLKRAYVAPQVIPLNEYGDSKSA